MRRSSPNDHHTTICELLVPLPQAIPPAPQPANPCTKSSKHPYPAPIPAYPSAPPSPCHVPTKLEQQLSPTRHAVRTALEVIDTRSTPLPLRSELVGMPAASRSPLAPRPVRCRPVDRVFIWRRWATPADSVLLTRVRYADWTSPSTPLTITAPWASARQGRRSALGTVRSSQERLPAPAPPRLLLPGPPASALIGHPVSRPQTGPQIASHPA